MPPFAGDALRACDDFAVVDDSAAAARAHDDAKNQFLAAASAVQRLGQRKTIRVILHLNFPAENAFEFRFQRLAVQAGGVGIFQKTGSR